MTEICYIWNAEKRKILHRKSVNSNRGKKALNEIIWFKAFKSYISIRKISLEIFEIEILLLIIFRILFI